MMIGTRAGYTIDTRLNRDGGRFVAAAPGGIFVPMQSTIALLTMAAVSAGSLGGCSSYLGNNADAEATASDAGSLRSLLIADPNAPIAGYDRFAPDEKRNNPSAGDPSYVYLHAGTEAVVIAGPDVASAGGLFTLTNPGIDLIGATDVSADGYTVTVNGQLGYRVAIDDFEYEVTLARVELSQVSQLQVEGQVIQSRFVFTANPTASGVAHDIAITAVGLPALSPAAPVTVEVR